MVYGNMTNVTGFVTLMQYSNTVTNDLFGPTILLAIFIVSFLALKAFTTERALATSLFVTGLLSIFMGFTGLINNSVMVPTLVLAGLSLIVLVASE